MPYSEHQVIRAAAAAPLVALATPNLPRTAVEQSELAHTVLGELADEARSTAHAQGYAMGWAQGRREAQRIAEDAAREAEELRVHAEAGRRAEHAAAVAALGDAADQVRNLVADLTDRIEAQGTELAWALTRTLVGRELAAAPETDVIRRVLDILPASPVGTVRLHPSLVDAPIVQDLIARGLRIEPDPTLDVSDALVEVDGSITDLRISAAMERVKDVLS